MTEQNSDPLAVLATAPAIVCFAGQDWMIHSRAHCDFQVMREIGRQRRVLVVNSIGMRMPNTRTTDKAWRRVRRKAHTTFRYYLRRPLKSASPGLWVMTPLSLPFFGESRPAKINTFAVAAQVWLTSRLLRLTKPWVLAVVPTSLPIIDRLAWDRIVYYRADDHAAAPDVDVLLIKSLEDQLIERSARVLYSSQALMTSEASRSADKAQFLDHGVETSHFSPNPNAPEPSDLLPIPHPRIGFFGQIDFQSTDIPLLERLARERPDAHLVLIGRSATDLSALEALPNVHALGFRPYEEVPLYGRHFDVAVCPMPQSDWVRAINPIKLKEYLSLGLPIVATYCPDVERFAERLTMVKTADDFIDGVDRALVGDVPMNSETRRASVLAEGWDRRAADVVTLMHKLDDQRSQD